MRLPAPIDQSRERAEREAFGAPRSATEVLLQILTASTLPGASAEAKLAAAEGLAARWEHLTTAQFTTAIGAITQIVRETTVPLHRVRAARALLTMGIDVLPEIASGPEVTP